MKKCSNPYRQEDMAWYSRLEINIDPRESCCPILHYEQVEGGKIIQILGTVFFLSPAGIFITARHVVEGYPDGHHGNLSVLILRQPMYKYAKVMRLIHHPLTDISIGIIDLENEGWRPKVWSLSSTELQVGEPITSFGYSQTTQKIDDGNLKINLSPDFYEGTVTGYHPQGRGISKWPVYSHTMVSQAGISGGPVIHRQNSLVYGVCCTGYSPGYGGTFSDIRLVLDLNLPFVGDSWNTLRGISQHRPDLITIK